MPAPLSVVIPTLNAGRGLPRSLAALVPGNEAGLLREVVVSDGGSCDETCEIAEAAGCRIVTGAPGRGGQLARGAAAARGDWLLFLHADTALSADWPNAVADRLPTPDRAGAFRLRMRGRGPGPRLVARGANLRTRALGLPYGDQGLLLSRALYDASGGYDAALPLFEDVDLVRRLARKGGRGTLSLLPAFAETAPTRYERDGYARRVAANQWLLARYLLGAPPARLAARYG